MFVINKSVFPAKPSLMFGSKARAYLTKVPFRLLALPTNIKLYIFTVVIPWHSNLVSVSLNLMLRLGDIRPGAM